MADIHDWLEHVHEPASPPIMAAMACPLVPTDRNPTLDFSMDEILPLGLDEDGNMCFQMPHAWDHYVGLEADAESIPIDPALQETADLPTFVTVPEQYAETSSKLLIYLAKVLDIPEATDPLNDHEMTFTAEELDDLEPIDEVPSKISGTCVNLKPRSKEIKEVIDYRRVGPNRQAYYLAKTINGDYYWFQPSGVERDRQLRKIIGDYRYKSRADKAGDGKELRSGRKIRL